MLIEEMTSREFSEGLQMTRTVLLPVGATEEHGPHLPSGTDTFQARDVCARLAERRPIFVAPAIPYGVCRSTIDHAGTISISTETLKSLVRDVVHSLYLKGLRDFVILSGHAGGTHNATLLDAGETLLKQLPEIRMAVVTELDLVKEEGGHITDTDWDSHAGEIETSRMLATRPQMVKGRAAAEAPQFPKHILVRNKTNYWKGGVWGDPDLATAEKGRKIEALVVAALERLVERLETFSE
jgi:creatinine amidohydrolase